MSESTPNRIEKPNQKNPRKLGSREGAEIRIELINRGLSAVDLARAVDVSPVTLYSEFAKDFPSLALRRRIEHFFGRNIWNSPRDFRHMQSVIAGCGFDPHQVNEKALRAWAKENGVANVTTSCTRKDLIGIIEAVAIRKGKNL